MKNFDHCFFVQKEFNRKDGYYKSEKNEEIRIYF